MRCDGERKTLCIIKKQTDYRLKYLFVQFENPSEIRSMGFQIYGAYKPRRERKAFSTNKPPAMRVRIDGYTKKGILLLQ